MRALRPGRSWPRVSAILESEGEDTNSNDAVHKLVRRFTGNTQDQRALNRSRVTSIEALYDAHVDDVYRFVYRRCQDDELSKDITQETFLRVVRGPIDPDAVTLAWLKTVARNRLFDVLSRQQNYNDRLRLMVVGESLADGDDVTERLRIEQALAALSVNHRVVLTLHYLDGYSVPAMADQLGRSLKSVEALVTRARRALREELSKVGDTDGS